MHYLLLIMHYLCTNYNLINIVRFEFWSIALKCYINFRNLVSLAIIQLLDINIYIIALSIGERWVICIIMEYNWVNWPEHATD